MEGITGDEGDFQHTFSHPSLPSSQSLGITDDETGRNGLSKNLVRFECHQTITKNNRITVTRQTPKSKPPLPCNPQQVLLYFPFS